MHLCGPQFMIQVIQYSHRYNNSQCSILNPHEFWKKSEKTKQKKKKIKPIFYYFAFLRTLNYSWHCLRLNISFVEKCWILKPTNYIKIDIDPFLAFLFPPRIMYSSQMVLPNKHRICYIPFGKMQTSPRILYQLLLFHWIFIIYIILLGLQVYNCRGIKRASGYW